MPSPTKLTDWAPHYGYLLQNGLAFETRDAALQFAQDYAFRNNVELRADRTRRGGKSHLYRCSDERCPFFISLLKRNSKRDRRWFVSKFSQHRANCNSTSRAADSTHYTRPVTDPAESRFVDEIMNLLAETDSTSSLGVFGSCVSFPTSQA